VETNASTITTRSVVANEEGMYTLTIESPALLSPDQSAFEVQFPIKTDFFYLPPSVIEIKNQTSGYLYLLVDGEVQKFPVQLGNQRNDWREIKEKLNASTQIITNYFALS
jgi:hypothetical protein